MRSGLVQLIFRVPSGFSAFLQSFVQSMIQHPVLTSSARSGYPQSALSNVSGNMYASVMVMRRSTQNGSSRLSMAVELFPSRSFIGSKTLMKSAPVRSISSTRMSIQPASGTTSLCIEIRCVMSRLSNS
jgi:hypothetical protein